MNTTYYITGNYVRIELENDTVEVFRTTDINLSMQASLHFTDHPRDQQGEEEAADKVQDHEPEVVGEHVVVGCAAELNGVESFQKDAAGAGFFQQAQEGIQKEHAEQMK